MKSDVLSHRYAKAMLGLGQSSGQRERIGEQLTAVAELLTNSPDLRLTLENPTYSRQRRQAIIVSLATRMGFPEAVRNLLLLLIDRNRIGIARSVARDYRVLADEAAGRVRPDICSARPLAPGELGRMRDALERLTGKSVLISTRVDPELIAGIVATIGSVVYDGSILGRLELLRAELLRGRV